MYRAFILLLLMIGGSFFIQAQDKSEKLNYALIDVAASGDLDSLIKILRTDPNIDFRDANSGTALFYAAQNNHLDIVKVLVYNGADIDYGLDNGFTPLMSACYNGYFETAEYLANSDANLNGRDEYWVTALHYAVAMREYYIVDMLLFYGALPDLQTYEKTSPLLVASLVGDTAIAQLLLDKKALVNLFNEYDDSPLSVAVQNKDTAMFDYLIEHGAKLESIRKSKYEPFAWALLNENLYAFEKLKPNKVLSVAKNNRFNPLNIAYAQNNKQLARSMKNEGYSSGWMPYFNALLVEMSTSFNSDDAFYVFGMGLQDVKYDLGMKLSFGTRFKKKAIVFEESADTYMQLWEHRRFMELAVSKHFPIKMELLEMEVFAGIGFQFMFGSYDGIHKSISPSLAFIPQLGLQFNLNPLYFILAYEYTSYGLKDLSNHKLKIGMGYHMQFEKKPKKYELPWL
ncbi:MAG: ankyrin repeat domain-containing protein [Bacteroidales bacterium]|nr:ankyrin repeat domain-containing protein [Bacteroidales bacterium]